MFRPKLKQTLEQKVNNRFLQHTSTCKSHFHQDWKQRIRFNSSSLPPTSVFTEIISTKVHTKTDSKWQNHVSFDLCFSIFFYFCSIHSQTYIYLHYGRNAAIGTKHPFPYSTDNDDCSVCVYLSSYTPSCGTDAWLGSTFAAGSFGKASADAASPW